MKVKELEISIEATVPTGNFSNVKPGYRVVVSLEPGDAIEDVKAKVERNLDRWLEDRVSKILEEV